MSKKRKIVDRESLPYRPCVGIMVLNADGLVWAGRRVKGKDLNSAPESATTGGWWQMPQGGIDNGEKPKVAALRELKEETGTANAEIIGKTKDWLKYDLPVEAIGVALKGKYRGQMQKWFALRFLGEDSEINISPEGHRPEFDAWQWVPITQLSVLVVPFKRDVYCQVVNEFGHLAEPCGK